MGGSWLFPTKLAHLADQSMASHSQGLTLAFSRAIMSTYVFRGQGHSRETNVSGRHAFATQDSYSRQNFHVFTTMDYLASCPTIIST
jgi:hypothetical protein